MRSTLDALAFDGDEVTIVGEHDHPIRHSLIARSRAGARAHRGGALAPAGPRPVRPLPARGAPGRRGPRGGVERRGDPRPSAARRAPWAALGASSAAALYGCAVLREGVEDEADNVTRFVWIAPAGARPAGEGEWRTTLVFSELGEDHPGALVDALTEFSSRARQPHPHRVPAAPPGPRALHVLHRPRGGARRGRRRGRGRRAADEGGVGAHHRELPRHERTAARWP